MKRLRRASRERYVPPPAEPLSTEDKLEEIHRRLVRDRHAELYGMLEILGNRRRMMWLNFNAGLARGVGFFLGVTLIGALLLGGLALAFNWTVVRLGFADVTLEKAVRAAVRKFEEVQRIVDKTHEEVQAEVRADERGQVSPYPEQPLPRPEEHFALPPQPDPPR